ncbi:hypothetical protein [Streptacidiphilus sp. PAMC 29251]
MSLDTSLPDSESDTPSGMSRRGLIRNAAGAGAATLAAGALLSAATGIAAAAEPSSTAAAEHHAPASAEETLIVHVRNARTGEIDIFHGHHHRTVKDRALTAALLRAAN